MNKKRLAFLLSIFILAFILVSPPSRAKITGWTEATLELFLNTLDTGAKGDLSDDPWFVRASALKKNNLSATTAPTGDNDTDEGYEVGSVWIDVTNDNAYICLDPTDGAAVWRQIGGTSEITGSFNLADNEQRVVDFLPFTAGDTITVGQPVYLKTDGSNGARVYRHDCNGTDVATHYVLGVATNSATSGNSVTVYVDGLLMRNDAFNVAWTYNQDEGKPLFTGTTPGALILTRSTTPDESVDWIATVVQVYDLTAGTHCYLLLRSPTGSTRVPTSS